MIDIKLNLTITNKTDFEVPQDSKIIDTIKKTLADKGMDGEIEVDVSFVNKDEIKKLNQKYRQIDQATDVLSFPIFNRPQTSPAPLLLGDIAVCPTMVEDNDLLKIVRHGLLHLLGEHHD